MGRYILIETAREERTIVSTGAWRGWGPTPGVVTLVLALSACTALVPAPGDQTTGPPPDSEVAAALEPVIVVAGPDVDGRNVTASAYVAGILEQGGTCSFWFTRGSAKITAKTSSVDDRSGTNCGSVQVPIERFTRGTWDVTIAYTSLAGQTTVSLPVTMEIP
jgi:hypothetical protein